MTNITNYTSQHYREDSNRSSEAEPDTRCTSINVTETVDMPSVKLWKSCGVAGFVVFIKLWNELHHRDKL